MQRTSLLWPFLALGWGCTSKQPFPTEQQPEFAIGCTATPTITADKSPVSVPAGSTGNQARFFVKNNCAADSSGPWDFLSSRTGQVASVGAPSPYVVTLTGGQTQTVTVLFTAASSTGSGSVVLKAIRDTPLPVTTTSGTKTVNVTATAGVPLRVGLFSMVGTSDIGIGPGGNAGDPMYRAAIGIPSPSTINTLISTADNKDVLLVLNLADGRSLWSDAAGTCLNYNATKYESQIRRFAGNATLTDALARRRVVVFVVDEPYIAVFCNSVPPSAVNQMGLLIKSIWPGAITIVRGPGSRMKAGWAGGTSLGSSFWTGIDYGWSQYEGTSETPAAFFAREKSDLAGMQLGMVPGHNIWNAVSSACWDYLNTGSSSGRIHGTASATPGRKDSCATAVPSNTKFVTPPSVLGAVMDAAYNNPDAPFFGGWTHINTSFSPQQPFAGIEAQGNYVAALDSWITKAAGRTSWSGWRPAK